MSSRVSARCDTPRVGQGNEGSRSILTMDTLGMVLRNRMKAYYEQFNDVRDAISREKQIKGWSRRKKEELIGAKNSRWTDLAATELALGSVPSSR